MADTFDPPVGVDDTNNGAPYQVAADQQVEINVLANDYDPIDGQLGLGVSAANVSGPYLAGVPVVDGVPQFELGTEVAGTVSVGSLNSNNLFYTANDPSFLALSEPMTIEIWYRPNDQWGVLGNWTKVSITITGNATPGQTITGTNPPNTICGGSGNDWIVGGNNKDVLDGKGGNDTVDGGNGVDHVSGGAGQDLLKGGNGDDTVIGGAGDDSIVGGNGVDLLQGDEGNDTFSGGNGNDDYVISWFMGDDVIIDFEKGKDDLLVSEDMQSLMSSHAVSGGLMVTFDGFGSVFLKGYKGASLASTDWVIV